MLRYFFILSVAAITVACQAEPSTDDQLVASRMEWLLDLKTSMDTAAWPGLGNPAFDVPFLYFSEADTWIANPTADILKLHSTSLIWKGPKLKVYKASARLNELPFQLDAEIELSDEKSFDYMKPHVSGSSPEETRKTIPHIRSTEAWASMILHEYFHAYQYKHKPLTAYHIKHILPFTKDTLHNLYRRKSWFKQHIDKENGLLLKAIAAKDQDSLRVAVKDYIELRENRRLRLKETTAFDIALYEDYYEKIEGSARYLELKLLEGYKHIPPFHKLLRVDTTYKAHLEYKDYSLEKEPRFYKSDQSGNYVYATGLNQLRLLDKLGIDYKSTLFIIPESNAFALLKEWLGTE